MSVHPSAFVHETAIIEPGGVVGSGSEVWHHCHLRSGARVGTNTRIGKNVYVDNGGVVGDGCKIQNNVSVYRGVTLANNVFVGPSAVFTNDVRPRADAKTWEPALTLVDEGATIGANATIVAGITIGAWAMVGAGAVVVHSVSPHELVAGNPARRIGWVCACGRSLQNGPAPLKAQECASCGRTTQPGL
jgi:UDP-2-acetamido-3-amino-2,3-dideoxy-glucuronate N-acetyltransferase